MLGQPPMRYQPQYVWLILLAALDIMLTWVILFYGGREENLLAGILMGIHGPRILVVYKFPLVVLVILFCEIVGRKKDQTGRRLANLSVAISAFPVVWSLGLLLFEGLHNPGAFLDL